MEDNNILLIIGLIFLFIVIFFIPLNEEMTYIKAIKILKQDACKPHKWIKKDSGIENHQYLTCEVCGFLPESDDFEAKE